MAQRVTIRQIAERAGVGLSTVSRVMNNHPDVSDAARAAVEEAVRALNYRTNFSARAMRTQQSQIIAFITDQIATTPYAVRTIEGAQMLAWEHGKLLFVVNTHGRPDVENSALEHMLERQVEGVIYAAMYHRMVEPPPILRELPTVLVDCFSASGEYPSVVPDEEEAAFEATTHLIAAGHRRIALINLRESAIAGTLRTHGYIRALETAGLPVDRSLIHYGNWTTDMGYDLTGHVMARDDAPTALFCANDRTAMGAYMALHEIGRRIPHDVAVVGFDDQEVIAAVLRPPLTTMALPHDEMGRWAVRHLVENAGRPLAPVQQKLTCPLIVRDSVRLNGRDDPRPRSM
jgi:LacI family transcriptional regulator